MRLGLTLPPSLTLSGVYQRGFVEALDETPERLAANVLAAAVQAGGGVLIGADRHTTRGRPAQTVAGLLREVRRAGCEHLVVLVTARNQPSVALLVEGLRSSRRQVGLTLIGLGEPGSPLFGMLAVQEPVRWAASLPEICGMTDLPEQVRAALAAIPEVTVISAAEAPYPLPWSPFRYLPHLVEARRPATWTDIARLLADRALPGLQLGAGVLARLAGQPRPSLPPGSRLAAPLTLQELSELGQGVLAALPVTQLELALPQWSALVAEFGSPGRAREVLGERIAALTAGCCEVVLRVPYPQAEDQVPDLSQWLRAVTSLLPAWWPSATLPRWSADQREGYDYGGFDYGGFRAGVEHPQCDELWRLHGEAVERDRARFLHAELRCWMEHNAPDEASVYLTAEANRWPSLAAEVRQALPQGEVSVLMAAEHATDRPPESEVRLVALPVGKAALVRAWLRRGARPRLVLLCDDVYYTMHRMNLLCWLLAHRPQSLFEVRAAEPHGYLALHRREMGYVRWALGWLGAERRLRGVALRYGQAALASGFALWARWERWRRGR